MSKDRKVGDLKTLKKDPDPKIQDRVASVSDEGTKPTKVRSVDGDVNSNGRRRRTAGITKEGLIKVALYSLWVVAVFYGVQLVMSLMMYVVPDLNLSSVMSLELRSLIITSAIFASTVIVALVIPPLIRRTPIRGRVLEILGLTQKLPRWRDIGLAIAAYISCFAAAIGLTVAVQLLFPSLDMTAGQSLPFDQEQFYAGFSLVWIYLTLGVAAPVGEELIFRGYLFGRIRRFLPASITIVITAFIFSMLHVVGVDEDGAFRAQWNVVVALLPLSIGLGILREYTGSVWASIILHSIQNSISFLLLFVVLPTQGLF